MLEIGIFPLYPWPLLSLLCPFLSSSVSAQSTFSSYTKKKKPFSPSPHFNPFPSPLMARTRGGKPLSNCKSPQRSDFEHAASFTDFSTSMWALNGYSCSFFTLYITQFAFGYLKSIDLKSVGLRVNIPLLLSLNRKAPNRCPHRVQTLMKPIKKRAPAEKYEHFFGR